jgi:hypothetical protein
LASASGCQDHTTSPSAFTALVWRTVRVHRIPPHVRDDRETPLAEAGRRQATIFSRKTEAEYFSQQGWTVESALNHLAKFESRRTIFVISEAPTSATADEIAQLICPMGAPADSRA